MYTHIYENHSKGRKNGLLLLYCKYTLFNVFLCNTFGFYQYKIIIKPNFTHWTFKHTYSNTLTSSADKIIFDGTITLDQFNPTLDPLSGNFSGGVSVQSDSTPLKLVDLIQTNQHATGTSADSDRPTCLARTPPPSFTNCPATLQVLRQLLFTVYKALCRSKASTQSTLVCVVNTRRLLVAGNVPGLTWMR